MAITETSFIAYHFEESGASGTEFETDKAKTDTPTESIKTNPLLVKRGRILEIAYRLNPANAVTYTLMLFEDNISGDYQSNSRMLYESDALRADDTEYRVACDLAFVLIDVGLIWYALDWTGAPGNTIGFIRVSGVCYV